MRDKAKYPNLSLRLGWGHAAALQNQRLTVSCFLPPVLCGVMPNRGARVPDVLFAQSGGVHQFRAKDTPTQIASAIQRGFLPFVPSIWSAGSCPHLERGRH